MRLLRSAGVSITTTVLLEVASSTISVVIRFEATMKIPRKIPRKNIGRILDGGETLKGFSGNLIRGSIILEVRWGVSVGEVK